MAGQQKPQLEDKGSPSHNHHSTVSAYSARHGNFYTDPMCANLNKKSFKYVFVYINHQHFNPCVDYFC